MGSVVCCKNPFRSQSVQTVLQAGTTIEITPQNDKNMLLSCRVKLAPSTKWRFSADMNVKGACSAVLPDKQKKQAADELVFTTPEQNGFTNLRIWIPGQKPGTAIVISNISLRNDI